MRKNQLFNKINRKDLKKAVLEEPFKRITISFYKYFKVKARQILRDDLYKGKPHSPLVTSKSSTGGRNSSGRITTRHKGGGHKRNLRAIDFKRDKDSIPGKVERIEYDPNRSANIALILYADGERRYILAPKNTKPGDSIQSGLGSPIACKPGLSTLIC